MITSSTTIFYFYLLYARLHVSTFLLGHHQAFLHYESKMLYTCCDPSMFTLIKYMILSRQLYK